METSLVIFGFIFGIYCLSYGLSALTTVAKLTKDVKNLQKQVEDIERRLLLTQDF